MKHQVRKLAFTAVALSLVGFAATAWAQRWTDSQPTVEAHPTIEPVKVSSEPTVARTIEPLTTTAPTQIDRKVIAGGGGTSTGGNLRLDGTVAEVGASNTMTGGSMSLSGGFWHTLDGVATPTTTIQFSAANYPVGEGNLSVAINVTRSGVTSGTSSVTFSTSDLAGAQNCNVFTGVSSSRCDFETRIATLVFTPGEVSKTLNVFIINDSYLEGPETFNLNLTNLVGADLGSPGTATVSINDNELATGPNPFTIASFFVRLHYLDFLNREPDASGGAFWINEITSCGGDPVCIETKRLNVSAAFFLSIEFQQTGFLVHRIYKVSYGDVPGTSTFGGSHQLPVPVVRLNEFLPDTQRIGEGVVVGQPGWETVLDVNKQQFCAEFVQRTRFSTAFPTSSTPAQFVDALFFNTGIAPTVAERDAAIAEFGGAGTSANLTARGRVLRRVAENGLFSQQEFNRAFVLMQYFGYLRRNPNDPQDSDYTGYDFWLTKLNLFGGNFVNADMVKAFITSGEYRQRFGP